MHVSVSFGWIPGHSDIYTIMTLWTKEQGKGGSVITFEILEYVLHLLFYLHLLFTEVSYRAPCKSYGIFLSEVRQNI